MCTVRCRWGVTPHSLWTARKVLEKSAASRLYPEEGSRALIRNVGIQLPISESNDHEDKKWIENYELVNHLHKSWKAHKYCIYLKNRTFFLIHYLEKGGPPYNYTQS